MTRLDIKAHRKVLRKPTAKYLSQEKGIRKQGLAKYMAENLDVSQIHLMYFRILLAWDKYIPPSLISGKPLRPLGLPKPLARDKEFLEIVWVTKV